MTQLQAAAADDVFFNLEAPVEYKHLGHFRSEVATFNIQRGWGMDALVQILRDKDLEISYHKPINKVISRTARLEYLNKPARLVARVLIEDQKSRCGVSSLIIIIVNTQNGLLRDRQQVLRQKLGDEHYIYCSESEGYTFEVFEQRKKIKEGVVPGTCAL